MKGGEASLGRVREEACAGLRSGKASIQGRREESCPRGRTREKARKLKINIETEKFPVSIFFLNGFLILVAHIECPSSVGKRRFICRAL